MRILFCHDGPLRKDEFNNYYGTAHNDDTFKRYYNIANDLAVATRVSKIINSEAKVTLSKITVSPFDVIECPNLSNFKGLFVDRLKAKKIIYSEVEKSDYIVVRLPSVLGFIAIDAAIKNNKPYLIEVVACPWDAFWNHSLKGKFVAPFMYYSTKKRVGNAKYSIYVTNNFLQNRYPTSGKSVNCSNVSLTEFSDDILARRIEKIKNINDNSKIVIGTTAAVDVKYKGQQYVIQALGKLKQQGITHFEYQLIGGGNQDYLKSVAKKHDVVDQVIFLGSLPHRKVFEWLDKIDLYAQPSRQEGLPRALIEAMSRGLPAFGANTAGIPELLDKNYIFSNTSRNIKEICLMLENIDIELMIDQSKRNFFESKSYKKELIEDRRIDFFNSFKNKY
ncbi:glycosyltransferase [uncultured Trichococcus sp.]|uniref:glycosyltransferase n=1 Tax=uncultured Trichococcus sp. TaxID=189665 RepID=UPI0029C6337A|nr:glycosyltransferase [uncultured Trichococcus sp.]